MDSHFTTAPAKIDSTTERINLDRLYIRHPLSTFIIDYQGDAMINAFIPPRARLLVDRSTEPKNGDIVLALLKKSFTVRYLKKNDHKCWLVPANRKYQPVAVTGDSSFEVWGVVTAIITRPEDINPSLL